MLRKDTSPKTSEVYKLVLLWQVLVIPSPLPRLNYRQNLGGLNVYKINFLKVEFEISVLSVVKFSVFLADYLLRRQRARHPRRDAGVVDEQALIGDFGAIAAQFDQSGQQVRGHALAGDGLRLGLGQRLRD